MGRGVSESYLLITTFYSVVDLPLDDFPLTLSTQFDVSQAVLDFDAFTGLSDMDIRVAMRNAAGPKPKKLDRMDNALDCIGLMTLHRSCGDGVAVPSEKSQQEDETFLGFAKTKMEIQR